MIPNNGSNQFSNPSESLLSGQLASTRSGLYQVFLHPAQEQLQISGPINNFTILNSFIPFSYGQSGNFAQPAVYLSPRRLYDTVPTINGILESQIIPVIGGLSANFPADKLFITTRSPFVITPGTSTTVTSYLPACDTINLLFGAQGKFDFTKGQGRQFQHTFLVTPGATNSNTTFGVGCGNQTRLSKIFVEWGSLNLKVEFNAKQHTVDGQLVAYPAIQYTYNLLSTRYRSVFSIPDDGATSWLITLNTGGPSSSGYFHIGFVFSPRNEE